MLQDKLALLIVEEESYSLESANILQTSPFWQESGLECLVVEYTNREFVSQYYPDIVIFIGCDITKFNKEISNYKKNFIPTVFLDTSLVNFKSQLPSLESCTDYIICSNLKLKKVYLDTTLNSDRIFICGNPILDKIKESTNNKQDGYIFFNISKQLNNENKDHYLKILRYLISNNTSTKICINLAYQTLDSFMSLLDSVEDISIINSICQDKITYIDNLSSSLIYKIQTADYVFSDVSDTLIYSLLMNKPTGLISSNIEQDTELYGLFCPQETVDFFKLQINLTEVQVNYYLTNYLPCTFDTLNLKRIFLVFSFILTLRTSLLDHMNFLSNKFITLYPQLNDPLFFVKKDTEYFFNGINKL